MHIAEYIAVPAQFQGRNRRGDRKPKTDEGRYPYNPSDLLALECALRLREQLDGAGLIICGRHTTGGDTVRPGALDVLRSKIAGFVKAAKSKALDGQLSGEHGIGNGRLEFLKSFIGEEMYQLYHNIKLAFAPMRAVSLPGSPLCCMREDRTCQELTGSAIHAKLPRSIRNL